LTEGRLEARKPVGEKLLTSFPSKVLLSVGESGIQYMVSWAHTCLYPRPVHDRFRRFYTAQCCAQHTDKRTDHATGDICSNKPNLLRKACVPCGVITSAYPYRRKVVTSGMSVQTPKARIHRFNASALRTVNSRLAQAAAAAAAAVAAAAASEKYYSDHSLSGVHSRGLVGR